MGHRERVAPTFTVKIPLIAIADGINDGWTDLPPARAGESFLTYPRRAAELVMFRLAKVDDTRATETDRKILEFCIGRFAGRDDRAGVGRRAEAGLIPMR